MREKSSPRQYCHRQNINVLKFIVFSVQENNWQDLLDHLLAVARAGWCAMGSRYGVYQ